MSFRINTNVGALNAHRSLTQNTEAFNKSMDRLSSGRRIVTAADDAAGLAIANKFRADVRSMRVAERNIAEATSLIGIAEGAAQGSEQLLERMKELATQAASVNAEGGLDAIDEEFQALKAELDRVSQSTQYQDTTLLDGTFEGTFQIGPSNDAFYQLTVDLSAVDMSAAGLGVDALSLDTQANAQAALDVLDTAIDTANSALGELGAYQNRLDASLDNVRQTTISYVASESVIRDVDFSAEMTNFSRGQVQQQVGAAMLASANASAQTVLALL